RQPYSLDNMVLCFSLSCLPPPLPPTPPPLPLLDALPISRSSTRTLPPHLVSRRPRSCAWRNIAHLIMCARPLHPFLACRYRTVRSEEHTSELQSRFDLVCRLLLL